MDLFGGRHEVTVSFLASSRNRFARIYHGRQFVRDAIAGVVIEVCINGPDESEYVLARYVCVCINDELECDHD